MLPRQLKPTGCLQGPKVALLLLSHTLVRTGHQSAGDSAARKYVALSFIVRTVGITAADFNSLSSTMSPSVIVEPGVTSVSPSGPQKETSFHFVLTKSGSALTLL